MSLLAGFRVVQIGEGLAAAGCGRVFFDICAALCCIDPGNSTHLLEHLNHGKSIAASDAAGSDALATADLIVCEGRPADLAVRQHDAAALRRHNISAVLVFISPFGQTGPRANDPAT